MPARRPARIKRHDTILDELYTESALLTGEDAAAYEALQKSVLKSLDPRNSLERAFTLEVVAKTWEILRLQRYRMEIVKAAYPKAVEAIMASSYNGFDSILDVKTLWLERDPNTLAALKRHLKRQKLGQDHLHARAYVLQLDTLERIDLQIEQLEKSRSRTLKTIAQLNAILSKRLAEEMKTIEGEFRRDDEPPGAPPKIPTP